MRQHTETEVAPVAWAARQLAESGYATLPGIFSTEEVAQLLQTIESAETSSANFRRSQNVFAIRNLLGEIPQLREQLLTPGLRKVLAALFPGATPHLTKAIYFDKPAGSNWLVAWHQDVMIAVNKRREIAKYGPWSTKGGETTVLPPREILEGIITLRLHLDDCDATNGALRVVPGSHRHGVISNEQHPDFTPHALTCAVPAGGLMLMQPLTLHASNRSTSRQPRRVIHLEFSAAELPAGLEWRERLDLPMYQSNYLSS
ncbi:phytanoyl-CoA dioxygenase family protein [Hymenobacter psychrotolerans]|uniref:Phytanoyl-CoA dioxygenase (PhyH) n=1 Tax=Hymenobacter psychrotolerans DSM 18569 TaxID=1121959 RepID=A0A1M7FN04_9BACT|nr:phytanoyl-CoA dioxygenase family protein [Hymenobacter psychrotolerans]SHM05482.1 Phytanoyl-CoA dioxygenase (PhyH) [Hymenobacter psychrotolerans DSM 18569]